ncbi:septum site-determining protein MinC [Acinetobacter sp. MD2(2019)]|uniref:septum site-determining protein MinC n=1 Tax=Acinetobacter sp. MD2(2019) TaxID=2605273 RepID=UPI002D1ECEB4|nr:septum site-determining protein MinC [Acinetobacter sp. MD2(2019)]MEB3754739.1 septum site-determining protein MinC [Acinetobacter sp. MD2(2019)]
MADIRITGRMVNFSRLTFDTNDHNAIRQQLSQMLDDTASHGALVILDSSVEQELIALIQLLVSLDLQPMAVVDGLLGDEARAIQFPVLPIDRPLQRIKPTTEQIVEQIAQTEQNVDAPKQKSNAVSHVTSYHNEMLRTGQCLVQDNGDVILNASMNSGSEIIASGNIHVYGASSGRMIAGASGDPSARIFCQLLNAELVSIAGTYCVADDIPVHVIKKPVQISLNEQHELKFEVLEI